MRLLVVHPSCLMYSKIYLRLESLGLELVAAAARKGGHGGQIIGLQWETGGDYFRIIDRRSPAAIAYSCNYLANVPEIIDLAKETRKRLPDSLLMVGGHSASFTAKELLEHADGALDCVLKGEGEPLITDVLAAAESDRKSLHKLPGVMTLEGEGPRPRFVASLDAVMPARALCRHGRRYFIGVLDPCASVEFSRGCPWACGFCSAWTFDGRSYRTKSPECVIEQLATIREPGVFLLDDVAFIQAEPGMQIGEMIARKGIRKPYPLETRAHILLRHKEVFQFCRAIQL